MQGGLTLHTGFTGIIYALSIVTFKWVPAAVLSLSAGGTSVLSPGGGGMITEPVTFSQTVSYLDGISSWSTFNAFLFYWGWFTSLSVFVSLILASLLVYCWVRLQQVRRFEEDRFAAIAHSVAAGDVSKTHLRWDRILSEIGSGSEQNWRLAILEADIMLNELLDREGYRGETMADKMKTVARGDFNTIDLAWEAHRMRNKIAHEGSSMPLSQRDAKRVIDMYDRVFREFKFIS